MSAPYQDAARKLLSAAIASGIELRRNEGQFLGGIAFDDGDQISEKQANWLRILVDRYAAPGQKEADNG